jgi:hypothetical protein
MSRKKAHGFHVLSLSGEMTGVCHGSDMPIRRRVMAPLELPPCCRWPIGRRRCLAGALLSRSPRGGKPADPRRSGGGPAPRAREGGMAHADGSAHERVWGRGGPSSTVRRLAQNRSSVSKNNSLPVMLTGVYDVGTTQRRWLYASPGDAGCGLPAHPSEIAGEPAPGGGGVGMVSRPGLRAGRRPVPDDDRCRLELLQHVTAAVDLPHVRGHSTGAY